MADLTLDEIGNDISTTVDGDLDLSFQPITGSRVVAESVLRRWQTRRGRCFWARHIGRGLGRAINADMTAVERIRLQSMLAQEALGVDGCASCTVVITYDADTEALLIQGDVRTRAGRADVNVSIGNAGQIIAAEIRERNAQRA
jgi:hypothetical protein